MAYTPIEDYGVIGDMHTVALVSCQGSIDWFCFPHFDSPSVFGALLDDVQGGYFRIAPAEGTFRCKQFYLPDTNLLITRFLSDQGIGELCDFMPVGTRPEERHAYHQLVRRVTMVRGHLAFRLECRPAFDYARAGHEITLHQEGAVFQGPGLAVGLSSRIPLEPLDSTVSPRQGVRADFVLREGESAAFVLARPGENGKPLGFSEAQARREYQNTVTYWRRWLGRSRYHGRWTGMVHRSALVLKLLTFQPSGAIVAAPTCGLPEARGGPRNWDYRYTWIRDASFTLDSLMRIGFTEEAHQFIDWLKARIRESRADGSLQIMYGIDGRHDLAEEVLDHLDGYAGSRPVRIGNGAYRQLQLDIYGELLDSLFRYHRSGQSIDHDLWTYLRRLLNWVADNWQQSDEGIWEVRGGARDFVYSKLMCWVALDRGLRIAEERSLPADRQRWLETRDLIYDTIMTHGWNPHRHAFVQSLDSKYLDASLLKMPLVRFVAPTDPRMLSTLNALLKELVSDSLVYRYHVEQAPDGLEGKEGTFNICTFWLVEALTWAGRIDEARAIFEKMLCHANHLGLFSEQIAPDGSDAGNFPQALTHLALISAAFHLNQALEKENNE